MKRILLLLLLSTPAVAVQLSGVKVIPFVKNKIVSINASTFNVTEIQFGKTERIINIQNGDIAAWTVDVGKGLTNTLFIKPTLAGSNTNMTVITNQHTYYFHLISDSQKKPPLYALKFSYPKIGFKMTNLNNPQLPSTYHWDYSFHGSTTVMPLHVFDDGHFTYFQLRLGQKLPAIFAVNNKAGKEAVVNFRKEGDYLVVHQLAPQFTLRAGKYHVASIFNNRLIRSAASRLRRQNTRE